MDMIRLTSVSDYDHLPMNAWGIREPMHDIAREAALAQGIVMDVVLVPAVCFNRDRWRLGHGKGYYDRFLAQSQVLAKQQHVPEPVTVGLCLSEQWLDGEAIPHDAHDHRMDFIVTPEEVIK
jgi:5-formyltetrahydrofolate cyclo-ligase